MTSTEGVKRTPGLVMEKSGAISNGDSFNTSSTLKLTDEIHTNTNGKHDLGLSESDLYDPFKNRNMTFATGDSGALLHLLKSSLGSGILAMPHAFKNGGLAFGVVGTVLVGLICTHCVQMLVRCSQILSARVKRPSLGFAETAEVAFHSGPQMFKHLGGLAREFVHGSLFATYYFGNTVYVVFIASSFKQVLDNHLGVELNIRWYILLLALPLVPLGIIRTLKYLVPFSATATVFIMFGLSLTLYYTFSDLPAMDTRHYFPPQPLKQLPIFFSTVLFAMEGIGTVMPIENSMKRPDHFLGCPGVLNIAMTIVVALYGIIGFFGYLKFGEQTLGSITLNLPKDLLAEIVKVLVALSILLTYGLQFTVPSEIVWKRLEPMISERHQTTGYYIMRGLMILGTVCVAIIVPNLGPIISLVGAVCFSILGLFCPAVIETITLWEEGWGCFRWRLWKNIVLALLAMLALVSGTYSSILEIIDSYSKE